MTDTHTFEAAYERLATSLDAPADADRLVAGRVATRRRRRRTTQGLVAAAAVAATLGTVTLVGGGAPASAPQRPAAYADTATDTSDPGEPTQVSAPDADELCRLTGPEALRLVRERYRGARVELEVVRDGQRVITIRQLRRLADEQQRLTRIVASCR